MSATLGYITPVRAFLNAGDIYMQAASGRVVEALAKHFDTVYMCARVVPEAPPEPFDQPLDVPNLKIIPQPFWSTTAKSLFHFFGIARAYLRTCRMANVLFIRGMCPYTFLIYMGATVFHKPVCHWIVGDSVALLQTSARKGPVRDGIALLYALQHRFFTRLGRWLTDGAFICNGHELARAYASPQTIDTVSSTIEEGDFFVRTDTCQGPVVRILFVGFVRPEKGIEYLLQAVSMLRPELCWTLEIAGPREFPNYAEKLEALAAAKGIGERVSWKRYVPNGKPLLDRLRAADLFVLPTLSEGTPHVLVEARANGLPCISTTVGGVPSAVTHGYDALLVPPKDARALARTIERIVDDGELRRALIRNGLAAARKQTLERFIATVIRELRPKVDADRATVPQE
jgi:glycosyltransferase involved in cell wall biosynthesis